VGKLGHCRRRLLQRKQSDSPSAVLYHTRYLYSPRQKISDTHKSYQAREQPIEQLDHDAFAARFMLACVLRALRHRLSDTQPSTHLEICTQETKRGC
jgi:hypothetical protein